MPTQTLSDARRDAFARFFDDEPERGPIAFVPVSTPEGAVDGCGFSLGIAVANEPGYNPVHLAWARYETWAEAGEDADKLNREIGLDSDTEARIVASTMGGKRFYGKEKA